MAAGRSPPYFSWAAAGYLVVTLGQETDCDEIDGDVRQLRSRFNIVISG